MAQSSLRTSYVITLVLMACFALAMSAPTTPPSLATVPDVESTTIGMVPTVDGSSTINLLPIIDDNKPSESTDKGNNELSLPVVPTTSFASSAANLDTVTTLTRVENNEMMDTSLDAAPTTTATTTTSANIIGVVSESALGSHDAKYDNETMKIHETSTEGASQAPSTVRNDIASTTTTDSESTISTDKSISPTDLDVTPTPPTARQSTTIEMPIKVSADNSKVMAGERDFPTARKSETKKGKFREDKKKTLKALEKKQKLKPKLLSEINQHAFVPTNEARLQIPTDTASEWHEATELPTISTSIKTAPTTIKSTTLTIIKSFNSELLKATTPSTFIKEKSSTEAAFNFNETAQPETSTEPSVTTNEQQQTGNYGGDNVIVLNTNSSGLIVVDIMENFGKENASSNTETFEIKMDLIDDTTTEDNSPQPPQEADKARVVGQIQRLLEKDDIFLTTIDKSASTTEIASTTTETLPKVDASTSTEPLPAASEEPKPPKIDLVTTTNDDIILINESAESTPSPPATRIKWNQVKSDGNIRITFDNIDLPNQNVNVSIENGELVIDSIDISVLNKAEAELKKRSEAVSGDEHSKPNKNDSLEIILIEEDSRQDEKEPNPDNSSESDELTTRKVADDEHSTTIHFDVPAVAAPTVKHDRNIELSGSDEEDGIKIKTTDKDSDTVFYISNTEVKVIESIPTASPGSVSDKKKYYPAIYEEDVIVDVPNKTRTGGTSSYSSQFSQSDKYEEDIVLSPLTSDFDPKDINYIGEAFLDVEESSNGLGNENHHIIPLTSDVVIQPVELRDMPSIGYPIIGELPPQIELDGMVFSDDYDSKQTSNFRVEEYYPNFLSNRLVKNQLEADVPREMIFDSKNSTLVMPPMNRTHISINTMINGTNMTALNSYSNTTAYLVESEENENAGEFN